MDVDGLTALKQEARSCLHTREAVKKTNAHNANCFPGSDKLMVVKSSISHVVNPVTGRQ